jgi:hypothetical protein
MPSQTGEKRRARWTEYRTEMVSKSGIAVFVFGNSVDRSGRTVQAEGMLEEFKIATESGLLVVPVGSTGYAAEIIHKIVTEAPHKYFRDPKNMKSALAALGQKGTPTEIVERIIKFIGKATGNTHLCVPKTQIRTY